MQEQENCAECGVALDTDDRWSCNAPLQIEDWWLCAGCGTRADGLTEDE
jgi:hypothetical protein